MYKLLVLFLIGGLHAQKTEKILLTGLVLSAGYDVYTTIQFQKRGFTEQNPILKDIAKNPLLFSGVKAVSIYGIYRISRELKKQAHEIWYVPYLIGIGYWTYLGIHNQKLRIEVKINV